MFERSVAGAGVHTVCRLGTVGLFVLSGTFAAYAEGLILVRSGQPAADENQVRKLADFYGLNIETVDIRSKDLPRKVLGMAGKGVLGLLIPYDALPTLDRANALGSLRRSGSRAPILVYGVTAKESEPELKRWSNGAISQCIARTDAAPLQYLAFSPSSSVTRSLAGWTLPAVAVPTCTMAAEAVTRVETVLAARNANQSAPVLLRTRSEMAEIFFVPQMRETDNSWIGQPSVLPQAFSSLAPFILFMSHVAGDHGWHLDGNYANLTIDDAWLTQPFGAMDYRSLAAEMERHNFHTTVAFIPWNFDRSRKDVVTLFQSHKDRFSICLHGNDHKHREFGDYSENPLSQQIADIKQGIARMEKFQALTGLSYDRFMVFPQGVAPQNTFSVLKKYDFLGTANSQNVPLGLPLPPDAVSLLRTYTVAYAGLPSLFRYPITGRIPRLEIAIESFLGNPLLFYGHQDLFDEGTSAFNGVADVVNRVQTGTRWRSLGEIARHLNLIRKRADGEFDVRMLANEMELTNPSGQDAVFYIERQEDPAAAIRSFQIDGHAARFSRSGDKLTFRSLIPAGQSQIVRIAYENDLDISRQDIGKHSMYVSFLRRASDWRDLHLSKSRLGRSIVKGYYHHGGYGFEKRIERAWYLLALSAVALLGLLLYLRRQAKLRR